MSGSGPAVPEGLSLAGRIRRARPAKPPVDPERAFGIEIEEERRPGGNRVAAVTVFLAGAECPFTCVFCDLWRYTLDGPTPPGALPRQLAAALAEVPESARSGTLKLYNASNFFDPRAVPPADLEALAALCAPFSRVVVECHPRFVGDRCLAFADRLAGGLEVALGVETVHPEAFPRLNKGATLEQIAAAGERLRAAGIRLRAFLLVGAPFVPPEADVDWTVRSAAWAFERGFETVALIPTRGGRGHLDRLAEEGRFREPALVDLEAALDGCLDLARQADGVVQADLWDLARFSDCDACLAERRARLEAINLEGVARPRVACPRCGSPKAPDTTEDPR